MTEEQTLDVYKRQTLDDFLDQMNQVKKLGSIDQILGMIPGMGNLKKKLGDVDFDEKEIKRIEAIILSMTKMCIRDSLYTKYKFDK